MSDSVILSLFDKSGIMLEPWANAGYRCMAVDIAQENPGNRNGIEFVQADIIQFIPPYNETYGMVFSFPPCTHLAVSGARWFKSKGLPTFANAIELVERALILSEAIGAPYLIENPVGTLSKYWRAPDHIFNPCDFGGYYDPPVDAYTKRTCVWTGNGLKWPRMKRVHPSEGSKMHKLGPSEDRADLRSLTPKGFAQAIYAVNSYKVH